MTDATRLDKDRALYARWRKDRAKEASSPDTVALAAYAEGRLDEDAAAPVELALAHDPDLLDAVLDARRSAAADPVPAETLARALAAFPPPASAAIIAFPLRRAGLPARYRGVLAWGALAASLLVVSLTGFGLGIEAQLALDDTASAVPVDLLDEADSSS